ncbi:MAG: DNA-directed DNA polymerase II small subunit [Candidatus Methanomethylophilaceae archaeon]|jgi:DNA polymerase II small subunit
MKTDVLGAAARRGIFLSPDALDYIMSNPDPVAFTNTAIASLSSDKMFVSRSDIEDCLAGDAPIFTSPGTDVPHNKRQTDIEVLNGSDVTGNSTCEGDISDFIAYFRSRYDILSRIISRRRDFGMSMSIAKAMNLDRDVRIIGMVYDVSVTKNGHIILTLEDSESNCKVFISKDSPLAGETFVSDEVIGIAGKPNGRRDLLIANEIFRPDVPRMNRWEISDSVSSVAFLSDVHVGSYTFLEDRWKRMVSWLKENAYRTGLDYIVFPGDVVDGIGIFPGQEEELRINDIYEQYEKLAEYLKDIPDHIKMVVHPGNHDAVRLAEPQPALGTMFTKTFDSNIMMVGNPVTLKIEGRVIQTYHGKSIDDWIAGVQNLTYDDPMGVMREMLRRRHLAPIYGQRTALAPEKKDYLAMETLPELFVSGHIHGAGAGEYNGVKIINASTWQSQTEYQKMHNFNPKPAIMPVVHLGTGEINMRSFMD